MDSALDDALERTIPYGARPGEDSFAWLFLNPAVNPADGSAVRTSGRRHAAAPARTVEPGTPLPEGIDMPRTPRRAPRHAPDVRIGCDVHAVSQTVASIELFGDRYLRRVFTPDELEDCGGDVERLSGRFAAKEAVLKVLQPARDDAVPWRTIEIRTAPSGAPYVVLAGTARALAARQGIERIDISLSHDGGVGLAVAAAVRPTLWEVA
jgi:holo-[acyl-carrier protein] synthase